VSTEDTDMTNVPEKPASIKRTSLNVDEGLWAEFKIAAIRRRMNATDALEAAIREFISATPQAA
jgi:hypothetical protein